jgi:hypothetical protein
MNETPEPSSPAAPGPSPETLKAALKAFKKRIKVMQLDQDSQISKSPLTGGRSTILSITPPNQYPTEVWDALVKDGKLKYAGQGMYELR